MKHRIEFFSDGVYAIIITLLVLELHGPTEPGLIGWFQQLPELGTYLLTAVIIGTSWLGSLYFISLYRIISTSMLWLIIFALSFTALIPLLLHNLVNHFGDPSALVIYMANIIFNVLPFHIMRITASKENMVHPEHWAEFQRKGNRAAILTLIITPVMLGLAYLSFWAGFTVFTFFSVWYALDISKRLAAINQEH